MQIKVSRNPVDVKDASGGSFIGSSGVYPVTLDFVSLEQTKQGAITFNLNVDYNGSKQTIYGNTIFNKDESVNKIGMELLNKLLVIAGLPDDYEISTETENHKVGKDQVSKEFNVIPELSGVKIQVQVKEVVSRYNGDITRNLEIYNFFNEDGASASELVAYETDKNIVKGTQLSKILEKPGTKETLFRDNKGTNEAAPTPEEFAAWKAAKSGKSAPVAKPAVAPKNPFAKK